MKFSYILMLVILGITGCTARPELITLTGKAQGTEYHFTYWTKDNTAPSANVLQTRAEEVLAQIDRDISNYREDSIIEKFNRQVTTETYPVPSEVVKLIAIAGEINRASSGCYDLTIKPLFDVWGFKANIFSEPSAAQLAASLAQVGMDKLVIDNETHIHKNQPLLRVDMSSIGQGFTVGKIAEMFAAQGIQNYLVEIGGEMQVAGVKPDGKPWRVAIEKPLPPATAETPKAWQRIVNLHSPSPVAVMTSGTYRHFFDHSGKRYSHILDARTGKPVEHNTVSVTVFHANGSYADAWSTAFLCLGREPGLAVADQYAISVLFIEQTPTGLVETPSAALSKLEGVVLSNQ